MLSRRISSALLVIIALAGAANAEDRVQSELRFVGHNKAEKTAGVWVDGQYVGSVKELSGDKKIMLLPGKHDILVRQAWYQDYGEQVILEPGKVTLVNVSLTRAAHPTAKESRANPVIIVSRLPPKRRTSRTSPRTSPTAMDESTIRPM